MDNIKYWERTQIKNADGEVVGVKYRAVTEAELIAKVEEYLNLPVRINTRYFIDWDRWRENRQQIKAWCRALIKKPDDWLP